MQKSLPPSIISSASMLTFHPDEVSYNLQDCGDIVSIAIHPSGEDIVYSTTNSGCKLFELSVEDDNVKLLAKDSEPLQSVGMQNCIEFSLDDSRFATGGATFAGHQMQLHLSLEVLSDRRS